MNTRRRQKRRGDHSEGVSPAATDFEARGGEGYRVARSKWRALF